MDTAQISPQAQQARKPLARRCLLASGVQGMDGRCIRRLLLSVMCLGCWPASASASALASAPAPAPAWQVYTHSMGGQGQSEGELLAGRPHAGKRAFYVALVRALLTELDLPPRIREVPLARGLVKLQSGPYTVLFNLDRTAAREAGAQWVGPISREADYLYQWRAAAGRIATLEQARQRRVCVLNGNIHDQQLSALGFSALYRHTSYTGCFQMLALGRVDLVASASAGLERKLEVAGIGPALISRTPLRIGTSQGYIALSLDVPVAEVRRWQTALERLKRSGRFEALLRQYSAAPSR